MRAILKNICFGLLVTVFMLFSIEGTVRLIPQQWIPKAARKVEELAPPDRGTELLRTRGFRGKRPCQECPDNNFRVMTIGGSSTYGVPMYYSAKTYSAYLQRMLDAKKSDASYEVLNAGVAGFGIWQIIEVLENTLLELQPDMIFLCAWFNDSSYIPGWYGFHNLSDKQAYDRVTRLRRIEQNALYQIIKRSKAYALARHLFHQQKKSYDSAHSKKTKKKIRRSSPKEFRQGVARFLQLSQEHGFQPVFILEPLNRTDALVDEIESNKYYQILLELAKKHEVTVVDTLTPLSKHQHEWLFYDFIHPNEYGHRIIAEAIYDTVFLHS